jgi:hypothetical protein
MFSVKNLRLILFKNLIFSSNNREVGLVYYIAGFDPSDYPTENVMQLTLKFI